jgi:hypothetical protein
MVSEIDKYIAFNVSREDKDRLLQELEEYADFDIADDKRDKFWSALELKIQITALNKGHEDKIFIPSEYKKFRRTQEGLYVYEVDGPWIYRNLSVIFGHGGHAFVHEFIPHGEIWVSKTHHNCSACTVPKGQEISKGYMDSLILHESKEYLRMKKGFIYWAAHNLSLEDERRAKFPIEPGEVL